MYSIKNPPKPCNPPLQSPKLLDQLREALRYKHYSIRTEKTYVYWARLFIRFHGLKHPKDMGGVEVTAFLTWLTNERQVAVSTHKQALSALLFLYRAVLKVELPWMGEMERPKARERVPTVLTRAEVGALLAVMEGQEAVLARLLYGTGLRLMEGLRLRVKDIDFDGNQIIVRAGKGGKDRRVMLPETLKPALLSQLERARVGTGSRVESPGGLVARRAGT